MRRNWLILSISIICMLSILTFYIIKEATTVHLVETVIINKQVEDFILHIRAEDNNGGIQVLRSLEYKGDEPITINHRTPLIGVDINKSRQEFTGSPISKQLQPGDIYHPQEPQLITTIDKGRNTLYVHCQFLLDGNTINIDAHEELKVQ